MNSNKYKSSTSKFFDETEDLNIENTNDSDTIEVEEKLKIDEKDLIDKELTESLKGIQSGVTSYEEAEDEYEDDEYEDDEYEEDEYEDDEYEDDEYEDDEYEEDEEQGIKGILKSKKAKYIAIGSAALIVLLSVVLVIFMVSKVEYIENVDIYVDGAKATSFKNVEEGTIDQVLLEKGYDEENYKRDESQKSTKDKIYLVQKKDITITYVENSWEAKDFEVFGYTLSDVLDELGLTLDENAVVYVDNDKKDNSTFDKVTVRVNTHIKIVVNSEEEEVVEEAIPFSIIQTEDDTLPIGTRKVVTAGQDGVKKITYKVFYSNGEEISREVVGEEVVKSPVDEVVLVGTKEEKPAPETTE